MNFWAIVFMILILGIVWGGFGFSLFWALRKERAKKEAAK